jgi:hypothetical protein
MIKSILALLLLLAAAGTMHSQDAITVKMEVPQEAVAGQEFLVTVEINKGSLEEFSRFQQELPAGFSAVQENSGAADFSYDNQRIRFIWLKLPAEQILNISYKVQVHERLKGSLILDGEFSYVENNERRSIVIDQKTVTITPSPDIAADQQVDVAAFAAVIANEKATMASTVDVTCIRQVPYPSRTGTDIMVNLLVYKKDMNKFAKIEEVIPAGFEAKAMESEDGLFTFKEGIAKFVWMNLPEVPGFIISYRLIPEAGKTINDLNISGTLSYIQEGRNIAVDIVQQDIDLSTVNEDNMDAVVAAIDKGEPLPVEKTRTEKVETTPPPPPPPKKDPVKTGTTKIPPAQLLLGYDGVYFRVQLAANWSFRDAGSTFAEYSLSRPVLVEQHAGFYKYTAGSFSKYAQAQQFKNSVMAKGITGAFIVSYRNGSRIDIMDALQATGGK